MVDFPIDLGIVPVGDSIADVAKILDEEWFSEDITILLSKTGIIATVVIDFSYTVESIVEYTLDSGVNWVSFNQGQTVIGGQSRFIRVTTGVELNFRSKTPGTVIRCVVSVP